jgi:hypothetical protein
LSDESRCAALGFTVKSGWAAAVLLIGPTASPRVADSRRIELSDPALPDSRQPYHAGFGTARGTGAELTRLVELVHRYGSEAVTSLIQSHISNGHQLAGAGLVVGSLIDPERIANEHIRIHAREGQLFRSVVAEAVRRSALACSICREKDVYTVTAAALRRPEHRVRAAVAALKPSVGGAWRAEQKLATAAAWLMLAAPPAVTTLRVPDRDPL